MSYLDQRMSPARIWALIIVAVLHVLIGFAFVTGFAQKFASDTAKDLDVFDVEEPPPPEEEPPPPEEIPEPVAPEIVTPPPIVRQNLPPPPSPQTTNVVPPPSPPTYTAPPRQPPAPPTPPAMPPRPAPPPVQPPPPPARPPSPARQTGGSISDADYPAAALRAEAQGTTSVSIQVGADGRVTGCTVTGSSGNGALDTTACNLIRRRFRYQPATRNGTPVASTVSRRITWRLPDDR